MTYFVIAFVAAMFFLWGILTIKYEIFPYSGIQFLWGKFSKGSSAYHRQRKSLFETINQPADVVMIGDSLTDGAEWAEFFPDVRIANRGINSDTSSLLLSRMDSIVNTGAKKAFLMIGVNDLANFTCADTVAGNIEQIVNLLVDNGIEPYLQSVLHTGTRFNRLNPHISTLNELIQSLADRKGLTYIDLNHSLSRNLNLRPELTEDGIHINGSGYTLWVAAIRQYIDNS